MPDTPDTNKPVFRLRSVLAVPAGWPPDVAPNQIITASHINAIKSSVYAWPGNVDGQLHTLSNVHLVNATGVLADPTLAAGDLIARDAAAIGRLAVGGAGQVLTVDTALPMKLKWATPALAPVLSFNTRTGAVVPLAGDYTAAMVAAIPATLLTSKGDLIAFSTATGRMPAGIDGQVLRVDSAATFGLRWAGESVPSVFTRTGPIVAQAGDYRADQVTNAVSVLGSYPDPVWLTSLSYGKLIGVPASFTPAAHTHDAAAIVSGVLATARLGTGVANNTVYLRGDGTWAAAGTGGGGGVISVFGRAGAVIAQDADYTAAMVGAIPVTLLTSTGDLLVRNNINQLTRLPIGASGQVLQADLATSVGMKWTSISASVQTPWVTNIDGSNFDLVNVHRLGVALAVPNYPIDVIGDINYTGVLRSNGVPVVFGGSQTPWTQNINASGFSLNNAGTIGVGVTAPQAAPIQVATHTPGVAGSLAVQDLDATTSGNPVLLVTGLGSEGTRAWAVGCRGGATFLKDLYIWNDRSSDMLFGTNSAERMRITAAGNVGIGSPQTLPHASGSSSVNMTVGGIGVNGWGDVTVAGNAAIVSGGLCGRLNFANYNISASEKRTAAILSFTDGTVDSGNLVFFTASAGALNNRMTITASGNVGIGMTPVNALSVNGAANFQGAVGIGVLSPQVSLDIHGPTASIDSGIGSGQWAELRLWGPAAVNSRGWRAVADSNGSFGLEALVNDANLGLVNRVLTCTRASPPSVGIGTSTPTAARLDLVTGSMPVDYPLAGAGAFRIATDPWASAPSLFMGVDGAIPGGWLQAIQAGVATNPLLLNPKGGRVGVGTSVPYEQLFVSGSIGIGSSTGNPSYYKMSPSADQTSFQIGYWVGGAWYGTGGILMTFGGAIGLGRSPGYQLDVVGDTNTTGLFRLNGAVISQITTRADQTANRALNGVYQNNTGKVIFMSCHELVGAGSYMHLRTDGGNPPGAIVSSATNAFGNSAGFSVSGWVMPGHFYQVYTPAGTLVTWLEWY